MTMVTAIVSPSARPKPENHRAEQAFFRVAQHGDAGDFPARRAQRVGGLALQTGHRAQDFARDGRDDGNDHDGDDDAGGQHADAIIWSLKERQKPKVALSTGKRWLCSQGTITKIPHRPRMTLGTAARSSMNMMSGWRTQSGASSVR